MIPFAPRPIEFLRIAEHAGWRIKLYSIVYDSRPFEEATFEGGLRLALDALPQPAVNRSRLGVGFCILHRGRGADYAVLGWWDRENELPFRVFVRAPEETEWRASRQSESFCVWDLQIITFEREAYVATILASPARSPAEYLSMVLSSQPSLPPRLHR